MSSSTETARHYGDEWGSRTEDLNRFLENSPIAPYLGDSTPDFTPVESPIPRERSRVWGFASIGVLVGELAGLFAVGAPTLHDTLEELRKPDGVYFVHEIQDDNPLDGVYEVIVSGENTAEDFVDPEALERVRGAFRNYIEGNKDALLSAADTLGYTGENVPESAFTDIDEAETISEIEAILNEYSVDDITISVPGSSESLNMLPHSNRSHSMSELKATAHGVLEFIDDHKLILEGSGELTIEIWGMLDVGLTLGSYTYDESGKPLLRLASARPYTEYDESMAESVFVHELVGHHLSIEEGLLDLEEYDSLNMEVFVYVRPGGSHHVHGYEDEHEDAYGTHVGITIPSLYAATAGGREDVAEVAQVIFDSSIEGFYSHGITNPIEPSTVLEEKILYVMAKLEEKFPGITYDFYADVLEKEEQGYPISLDVRRDAAKPGALKALGVVADKTRGHQELIVSAMTITASVYLAAVAVRARRLNRRLNAVS